MQVIHESKQWANGLTQEEFTKEFQRRYPRSDSVPDLRKWLYRDIPRYHGINPFNLEQMESQDNKRPERKEPEEIVCKGCGKEFTAKGNMKLAHRKLHEKRCKKLLAMKL
jgi:hypothetical protein